VRAVLDTSVLIGDEAPPAGIESSISAISIAELHFGLLVATDDDARSIRATRMGLIEARYPDPLPLDDRVAREWGRLQAAVAQRGGKPRRRMADLAIAATASVHDAVLITRNVKDFKIVGDLVDVVSPSGP
jgi:predicted nucleic acid-binding protein